MKGITVKIPADLHAEVKAYLEAHGMTMGELKAPSQFEQACETCGLAGGFAYSRNEENPSFLELC